MIPKDWMDGSPERVILHWTAGRHSASQNDIEHYHFLCGWNGAKFSMQRGAKFVSDNDVTGDKIYAAHTKGLNTKSIGAAFCAMHDATYFNPGKYPITIDQLEVMCEGLADICQHYGFDPLDRRQLLGHNEVEEVYGAKQEGKWDVEWLPGFGHNRHACMEYIRESVHRIMKGRGSTKVEAVETKVEITKVETEEVVQVKETISKIGGRKFVLSVLGVLAIVANERFGLNITEGMMENIANLIMVFVVAEGSGDIMGRFKAK